MAKCFEPASLGSLNLKNRFVRSATWEGLARADGSCSAELVAQTRELAKGELGLIISSHAFVSREGQAGPGQLAVDHARFIPALKAMVAAAHDGGSKIVLQLAHAGLQAARTLTKTEALAPSRIAVRGVRVGQALTLDEVEGLIQAFVLAAQRAFQAGFDGIQIHAAHGYLLSQFLSPHFNRRKDLYGGSLENRSRIVLDIVQRIRAALGRQFPVLIKTNSEDFLKHGLTVDEMLQFAARLEQAGIDGIELSGGTNDPASSYHPVRQGTPVVEADEVYYRAAAQRYKEKIRVPLLLVGGIRSYSVAAQLIDDGLTDFVCLSRPLIREPHLVARWKAGATQRATCDSCNLCFDPIWKGEGVYCVAEEQARSWRGR